MSVLSDAAPGLFENHGVAQHIVELDVPYEDKEKVKALGGRWSADRRRWTAQRAELTRFADWLPVELVDLGPAVGSEIEVAVLGLPGPCWRCGAQMTVLVGLIEPTGDLWSEDLLLCDDEHSLALAHRYLAGDVRSRLLVARYHSRTTRTTYLANCCPSCRAARGQFPLFHEEVPEVLAAGGDELVALAVVGISFCQSERAREARFD